LYSTYHHNKYDLYLLSTVLRTFILKCDKLQRLAVAGFARGRGELGGSCRQTNISWVPRRFWHD